MERGRFFCSDEKSKKVINDTRKNPNKKKDDMKFLAKCAAILSAVTIFAGFTYAHFTSEPAHDNIPQHAQVQLQDTKHFDEFMSNNLDTFKDLNPIIKKYHQLQESNPFSSEFREMIDIMNQKGNTIENLAKANIKAKYADLFNTTPKHITLDVSLRHGEYSVYQTKYDENLRTYKELIHSSDASDKSNLSQTIFALAKVQSSYDKDNLVEAYSKSANYYNLQRQNITTAKCEYVLQNGKIVELPPVKSNDKTVSQAKTSKTLDDDRDR